VRLAQVTDSGLRISRGERAAAEARQCTAFFHRRGDLPGQFQCLLMAARARQGIGLAEPVSQILVDA
jgi:hypothetical protein